MLRTALCDDLREHIDITMSLISHYQDERPGAEISAHGFSSGKSLLEHLEKKHKFDLYLLDVVMPDISGMELARQIRVSDPDVPIVFLTQSTEYALEAFNVFAVQYIVKPVSKAALFPVLDKIAAAHTSEDGKFILVSASDNRLIRVLYSSVIAVERFGRVMRFHLTSGEPLDSKTIRNSFEDAVVSLLRDERFLHVHQSFVINMAHMCELRACSCLLKHGIVIPIPKPKRAGTKKRYLEYLAETAARLMEGGGDENN